MSIIEMSVFQNYTPGNPIQNTCLTDYSNPVLACIEILILTSYIAQAKA